MLLALDIGNTQITIGLYEGDTILKFWRLATNPKTPSDEYGITLYNFLNQAGYRDCIDGAIIASVVLPLGEVFVAAIKDYLNIDPILVSTALNTGITIPSEITDQPGADRVANTVAAAKLFPDQHSVVVDLGTATTFDVIQNGKSFIGGIIAPGIAISAESLNSFTSLLPKVKIDKPENVIATTTIGNIISGVVIGHAKMINGLIESIEQELKAPVVTIGTGGYVDMVEIYMNRKFDYKSKYITLEGLRHIYAMNHPLI